MHGDCHHRLLRAQGRVTLHSLWCNSLIELFNSFIELKFLDDLPGTAGKSSDVVAQVGRKLVGVTKEAVEGKLAGVVEGQLELLIDDLLDGLSIVLAFSH